MDPESSSCSAIITDVRNERIEKGKCAILSIFFIGTSIGHIVTIALGVPMLRHCYNVALVVMIIGSILGFLQQIPEFFRNFIKLNPESERYVHYSLVVVVVARVAFLIAATVIIVKSGCENITPAWVCISINWGMLGFFVIVILVVSIVKCVRKRNRRYDD